MHYLEVAGETLGTVVIIMILFFLYFLPAIIAGRRKHHNKTAIFWLNFFVGWSFIGWVGSLVWSLTSNIKKDN